ncbi:hypothetical protein [Actinoplanes sp. L3-i22]|uniref:hypothetical protein n=1 Tax=Actinoplanes sp. L3-i22 TaxID=2836373 RepID=UPI001C77EE8C|nr:hypothetical protein [Actinoplanes sp. L3-i22]BCY11519.1 hypothetical protein L3i22_066070 [Actinoplanes sp. L3-i22]
MSEVELILTALMTGAAAGTTTAAQSAVADAYAGLRQVLRRMLTREGRPATVLDTVESAPGSWQVKLSEVLTAARADHNTQVLAAAQAVLAAADPAGKGAGIRAGDHVIHIDANYGAAAGTMTGPVTVSYGQVPNPPSPPGA